MQGGVTLDDGASDVYVSYSFVNHQQENREDLHLPQAEERVSTHETKAK